MPNWERTPPVAGLSVEEIKKRVDAGIKKRQQTGELRPATLKNVASRPDGPFFNKEQRRLVIGHSNIAIYALANNDRTDYCGAVGAINQVRLAAGFPSSLMQAMCNGIASAAAEASGESFEILDELARRWLEEYYKPSGKVISIAKGKPSDVKK